MEQPNHGCRDCGAPAVVQGVFGPDLRVDQAEDRQSGNCAATQRAASVTAAHVAAVLASVMYIQANAGPAAEVVAEPNRLQAYLAHCNAV